MKRFLITIRSKYHERAWESLSDEQKLMEASGLELPIVNPAWEEWLEAPSIGLKMELRTKNGSLPNPAWLNRLAPTDKDILEELFGEPRDLPIVTARDSMEAREQIHPSLRHRITAIKEVGIGG